MERKRCFWHQTWDFFVYCGLLIVFSAMLFLKCRYGYANIDESFYLTIPYRLCQGDQLFLNEWHLSQMSAIFLVPFVKLFLLMNKNTDGILIAFRYLYTAVQIGAAVVLYCQLRKKSKCGAICGSILWMIYAPYNIMALSYNSMGIIFLTLGLVLIVFSEKKAACFVGGVLVASAVLCCPYLALLWFVYAAAVVFFNIVRRDKYDLKILKWNCFLLVSAGAMLMALYFLWSIFSSVSLHEFLSVLPPILSDPEHKMNVVWKILSYGHDILFSNAATPYIYLMYILLIGWSALRGNEMVKRSSSVLSLVICVVHLISCIVFNNYINHLMLPLNICAFVLYIINRDRTLDPVFYGIWIPGMFYTLCIHFTSNQVMYAISSASTVSMVASAVIIITCIQKTAASLKTENSKLLFAAPLVLLLLLQLGGESYYRWNAVFWENSISEQTEHVENGPETGLLVSKEKSERYLSVLKDVENIDDTANVLFLSDNTLLYLCGNWSNAGFSAWLSGVNEFSINKLQEYYAINPEKYPDCIYVEKEYESYARMLIENRAYDEEITGLDNVIFRIYQ